MQSLLIILLSLPLAFFKAFVLSKIYTWYIEIPYHTIHIQTITWYGIGLLIGLMTIYVKYSDVEESELNPTLKTKVTYWLTLWFIYIFGLFFAWLAKELFIV